MITSQKSVQRFEKTGNFVMTMRALCTHCDNIFGQAQLKVVPHPPYSLDPAPYDLFFVVSYCKKGTKRTLFDSEQDSVKVLEMILKNMSKDGFSHLFQA